MCKLCLSLSPVPRLSPLALEAAVALLSLGVSLPEVCHAARSLHTEKESGQLSHGSW